MGISKVDVAGSNVGHQSSLLSGDVHYIFHICVPWTNIDEIKRECVENTVSWDTGHAFGVTKHELMLGGVAADPNSPILQVGALHDINVLGCLHTQLRARSHP